MIAVAIALLGGAGAAARYAVDLAIHARLRSDLPWATLAINITGALLLGMLTGLVLVGIAPGRLLLVLGTGFCGGYTTFGTASVDTLRLLRPRQGRAAIAYGVGTPLGTAAAGLLGLLLVGA